MTFRCPGQDGRKLTIKTIKCPACGYLAELFSDEASVKCVKCGVYITEVRLPSCVDWCANARECVWEERLKARKIE